MANTRHLLGLEGVTAADIELLLDSAESMNEISERDVKKVPTLRGKTIVNLFYEDSTRTRISFEIAASPLPLALRIMGVIKPFSEATATEISALR